MAERHGCPGRRLAGLMEHGVKPEGGQGVAGCREETRWVAGRGRGSGGRAWCKATTTFRNGTRGAVTVEFDDTDQFVDSGSRLTEWLERLSYSYQSGPNQALALGIRRIIGTPPVLTMPQPNGASNFQDGWNLSAAFHQKVPGGEIYVVYVDAAAVSTARLAASSHET